MPEIQFLHLMLTTMRARLRNEERGATAVEWVIITAVLIAIATAVGFIITNVITDKANGISIE